MTMTTPGDVIVLTVGLFVLLQFVDVSLAKKSKKTQQEELWLTDMIDYDYMGDDAGTGSDYCPPVPSVLPSGSCNRKPCSSDRTCADHDGKCCYNGCIYTCLYQVGPPGYFDWAKEPRRLLSSGRSWLVDSSETVVEAEPCSTSPVDEDEDPLLCPHGYVCSVEDGGNPKAGVPNSGKCVLAKDTGQRRKDSPTKLPLAVDPKVQAEMRRKKVCEEENGFLVLEGATVRRHGRRCICRKGKLNCRGGKLRRLRGRA